MKAATRFVADADTGIGDVAQEACFLCPYSASSRLSTASVRKEHLPAAALFGLVLFGASVISRETAASGSMQIGVQATVMRHASIASVHAPRSIAISSEDVARGYIDLDEPIEVAIRTNAPEGVLLGLALRSAEVRSVLLDGPAGMVRVSRLGATLPIAKQGQGLVSQLIRLKARLELASAAAPGLIAFPVLLFIAPN